MPKAVIPQNLYVGFQMRAASKNRPSADGGKYVALGFLTYRNEKGKLWNQKSFDNWRDKDIPRIPLDNNPTTGMVVIGFATRMSTSNKFICIEDPRNFQVEITVENFINILKKVTIVNGIIQDKMVWGWNNKLHLYKVGEDDYLEAKANFEYGSQSTILPKNVPLGSEIMLFNGKRGLYYGGWHIVEDNWEKNYAGYFNNSTPKPVKTKRYQFLKIDDHFEKWSSAQIKHIFSEGNMTLEEARAELQGHVTASIKREVMRAKAHEEINHRGIKNSWQTRNECDKIYAQFGLKSGGYSLVDKPQWNIFHFIYGINDKPIKQDWFEEYIAAECAKY